MLHNNGGESVMHFHLLSKDIIRKEAVMQTYLLTYLLTYSMVQSPS